MLALPKPDAKPTEAASDTDRPGLAARREAARRKAARRPTATATAATAAARAGQGAPVRAPDARERGGRRRRPAGVPAHRPHRRRAHARPRARPRPRPDRHQAASRSARRCPPAPCSAASAAPPRRKHPYVRFEIRPAGRGAPRVDPKPILDGWKLLESTAIYRAQGQEPVRRPGRRDADDRPDPADEQGDADAARARRPADPDLRLRPPGHPGRRDRPPRAGHARVPRRLRLQPDGHVAALRPLVPDRLGQRVRAHAPAPPSTSPRSTASRSSATRARARSPTW